MQITMWKGSKAIQVDEKRKTIYEKEGFAVALRKSTVNQTPQKQGDGK